jgi:hypothetical protein
MDSMDIVECPLCGMKARVVRRADGAADHYECLTEEEARELPNPCPPALSDYLRAKRKGKKTVALIGAAFTTASWAPFDDEDVEIWTCNELHALSYIKEERINKWFQLHHKSDFIKKDKFNHWEWLQKDHRFPIYMQMVYDDVPSSNKYPLRELQKELIHIERGELPIKKIFTSTFNFQMAMALSPKYGCFERIELYGVEMLLEAEYYFQREAMSFWLGKADGMGVDVWIPEQSSLLVFPLYAYEEILKADTGEIIKVPPEEKIDVDSWFQENDS